MKSTLLPQVDVKGSTRNVLASFGLRLRQHCQFLTLAFLVFKKTVFEGLIKVREITIVAESYAF
jgi:hypothetical protein